MRLAEFIAESIECSICYQPFHKAQILPCSHVFCLHCIEKAVETRRACPSCHASLSKRQFTPSQQLDDIVRTFRSFSVEESFEEKELDDFVREMTAKQKVLREKAILNTECAEEVVVVTEDRSKDKSQFEMLRLSLDESVSSDLGGDLCSMCGQDANLDDAIVFCDGCDIGVHKKCYNIKTIPDGPWFCDVCSIAGIGSIQHCCLCGFTNERGIMKMTKSGHWAHCFCAIWIPETFFKQNVIQGIAQIDKRKFEMTCVVCNQKGEFPCIKCSKCINAVHPYCAKQEGLSMSYKEANNPLGFEIIVYCPEHSAQARKERIARQMEVPEETTGTAFCCSGLSEKQKQRCKKLESLGMRFSDVMGAGVSHVIVSVNSSNRARSRTMKLLEGILRHCWIVSPTWATTCLNVGKLVHAGPYEVLSDSSAAIEFADAPLRSRLSSKAIFEGISIFLQGAFCAPNPSHHVVSGLILLGGGTLLDVVDIGKASSTHIVVVCASKNVKVEDWMREDCTVVSIKWLFDSVSSFKLQDLHNYCLNK